MRSPRLWGLLGVFWLDVDRNKAAHCNLDGDGYKHWFGSLHVMLQKRRHKPLMQMQK